jgi:hypothetical protein
MRLRRTYCIINTRISSAIETSVYVLVTVMTTRYSGSILSSILQGELRSGGTGAGGTALTENGTQYPGLVYSELNTPLTIDASGIFGTHPIALAMMAMVAVATIGLGVRRL